MIILYLSENMDKIYTPKQVAEILQVNVRTVLNYIKRRELKAIYLKRGYRIEEKDLRAFIERGKKGRL